MTRLPMAANMAYVFFQMAARVTSGLITGESVARTAQKSPTPVDDRCGNSRSTSDDDVGEDGSGGYMPPGTAEAIADWRGVIKSTEFGAQYDDYFERPNFGQIFIYFGINSMAPTVQAQESKALRDSGKIVHLYGTLFSNVPDYNGSQIQVDRIEVEG